jgi:uncharacterized protein
VTALFDPIVPVVRDDATAEFFDGTASEKFLLRVCGDCSHIRGPELPMCTLCQCDHWSTVEAVGHGRVVSWIVVHQRAAHDGSVPTPRIIATVELDEGPWVVSALVGADPGSVAGDLLVELAYSKGESDEASETVPVFRPATSATEL